MSYIGNLPTTQAFTPAIDYFSGNGSTTAFTLSRPVASVAQVQAVISNVPQNPGDAFTVSGNTITFTSAPPSGTNNIYVYYTSPITQVVTPSDGTVGTSQISSSLMLSQANGGTGTTTGYYGFKNRIINGAMVIDQRNAGAQVTPSGDPVYTLDRWYITQSQNSKFNIQQNGGAVTPPAGFSKYLGATVASAVTVGASDYFALAQGIEGFNISDFSWGTSSAATVTLSFWVRSSLTGTFGGALRNTTGNLSYPFTYTISSANTWEQKSVTITGPTSGTWNSNSSEGVTLRFGMGVGSTYNGTAGAWATGNYFSVTGATSVVGTAGATFYITGVQLEKGSTATSFDYRPYGTELQLCQRYYWKKVGGANASSYETIGSGFVYNTTTNARIQIQYPCPMRAVPTFSTNGTLYMGIGGGNLTPSTITSYAGLNSALADITITASTIGFGTLYYTSNTTSDYFQASAEL